MDAASMIVAIRKVYVALDMPFYRSLAAGGGVDFSEFSSTSQNLLGVVETLEKAPSEKIKALVAEYNDELTEQLIRSMPSDSRISSAVSELYRY